MATRFTEEQLKAIETIDRSVLVSAAAGSGKTAVLVERIINIILEGRAGVDEMLVVTFTKAAAAEMRLRLAAAIRRRMADHPEDAPRMKLQLANLYKSYISTIDSFALRVIREFFHEIDMEPDFSIADEVQSELMQREAVTELFEEAFENDSLIEGGSFRGFLRLYSEERTDEGFMDKLLEAYSQLRSMPDYFEWAYEKAEQLKVSPETFEGSALQSMMLADARDTFDSICEMQRRIRGLFADAGIEEMYESKLKAQEDAAALISSELSSGRLDEELLERINAFPSVRLVAKKDQKEAYETIKDEVKALRDPLKKELDGFTNRYIVPDFASRLAEMNATYDYTVYYLRLLEEFERRYEGKKREKRLMDFADTEHCAVRILKNEEAAETLRRRFKFIFVDEYQDTNNIQEYLISSVARPDNVFRVGDVKQSIYKFRQAEPEIFERLYAKYSEAGRNAGSGDSAAGIVIDLGRNFRTNDATIRYINHVFSHIMDGYDERAMLYTGLSCPAEYDFRPEVHVLIEDSGNTDEISAAASSAQTNGTLTEDAAAAPARSAQAEKETAAELTRGDQTEAGAAAAWIQGTRAEAEDAATSAHGILTEDAAAAPARSAQAEKETAAESTRGDQTEAGAAAALTHGGLAGDEDAAAAGSLHGTRTETADEDAAALAIEAGFVDEEIETISKEEAEAEYIARLAESIIGTEFYDSKAGVVRKAEARDVVILFRAVRYRGEVVSRALRDRAIEPHIEDSEEYFDTVEVGVALSLLMCIDNMKRDVPLISVLHSEIFSFDPEELAQIRIAHTQHMHQLRQLQHEQIQNQNQTQSQTAAEPYIRPAYHEAFGWYASDGPEGALRDKAAAAREKLLEWRRLSRMLPLEDFVWKLMVDSGYYRMAGAMAGGARRQANLRTLADRAGRFSKDSIASLSSFITFISMLRSRKIKTGQTPMAGKDDNVVRISTIHKSKGLEYPFVIVGGLGHKFREASNEKSFSFDSGVGVGMPYIDPARKYWRSTIIQRAINEKSRRDGYREELRLLYVAMTRARNKLYMVGTVKSEEELSRYDAHPKNFIKAMRDVLRSGYNTYHISPLMLTKHQGRTSSRSIFEELKDITLTPEEQTLYDEIDRRFRYRYPYEELLTAKAKYSVSEIRQLELEAPAENDSGSAQGGDDLLGASLAQADSDERDTGDAGPARTDSDADDAGDAGPTRTGEVSNADLIWIGDDLRGASLAQVDSDADDVGDAGPARADDEVVNLWNRTERKKKASAVDIGIAYHRIMEFLDFSRVMTAGAALRDTAEDANITAAANSSSGNIRTPDSIRTTADIEYIKERAEFLHAHNAIEDEVYRALDLSAIAAFFESNIGRRAAAADAKGKLRREKPFTLKTVRGGREMLVQGVIDCCFEEGGRMVLIDYKSNFIRPGRQHDREIRRIRNEYRVQIELYCEAVKKGTGMEVSEAYLFLFATGESISMLE